MAWTFTDNFDSYSNGDLNGQGSWSGDTDFDVQGTTTFQGAKAVTATNANGLITQTFTGVSSGVMYIAMMRPDKTGDAGFGFKTGASNWANVFLESNNIEIQHNGGTLNIITNYVNNQWYIFEFTFISTSSFSVRVHNGTSWSASSGTLTSKATGNIDSMNLNCGGTGVGYWDFISTTSPYAYFTNFQTSNVTVAASTNTLAYDAGSGSNRMLVVHVGTGGTNLSTGATYNGVAMTKQTSNNSSFISEIYTLANPDTGTNNLVVTWAGNEQSFVTAAIANNANSTVGGKASSTGGTTTTPQVTFSTTAENSLVFIGMTSNQGTSVTDLTLQNRLSTTDTAVVDTYVSGKLEHAAGSHTYGYTQSSTQGCCSGIEILYATTQALTLTAAQASFTYTGFAAILGFTYMMVAAMGSYVLTGFSALFTARAWTRQTKNTSDSWSNQSKT